MAAKKTTTEDRKEDPAMRSAGVSNVEADSTRRQESEQKRLQESPPPLAHVNPVTGEVLSQPLDTSKEANRNTVPGDGGVKDARPNNGRITGNPHTDKA